MDVLKYSPLFILPYQTHACACTKHLRFKMLDVILYTMLTLGLFFVKILGASASKGYL